MARRVTDAQRLLRAAIGEKKAAGLPDEVRRKFEAELEGIQLPNQRAKRESLLESFAGVSGNYGAVRSLSQYFKCMPCSRGALKSSASALGLALRSSNPLAYARFLARKGFAISSFRESMGIFADGREIAFQDVPAEKKQKGEEIVRLVKDGSSEALRKLAEVLRGIAEDEVIKGDYPMGYVGPLTCSIADVVRKGEAVEKIIKEQHPELWESVEKDRREAKSAWEMMEQEHGPDFAQKIENAAGKGSPHGYEPLLPYGIYTFCNDLLRFDRYFESGGLSGYILSESVFFSTKDEGGFTLQRAMILSHFINDGLVQHELQHLFDNLIFSSRPYDSRVVDSEYRAFAAGIAFSENPISYFHPLEFAVENSRHLPWKSRYCRAIRLVHRGMSEACKGGKDPAVLRRTAHDLLNGSYKKAVGLTYDEILEPFQRQP